MPISGIFSFPHVFKWNLSQGIENSGGLDNGKTTVEINNTYVVLLYIKNIKRGWENW